MYYYSVRTSSWISIHAPAKGATITFEEAPQRTNVISIHAPAKGATDENGSASTGERISIHAPAKGATFMRNIKAGSITYFNPRSREGSDYRKLSRRRHFRNISIHAPAKGATARSDLYVLNNTFQSTLPRRERPM